MPRVRMDDTISALATPPGEGAIGIIRLSGPQALSIAGTVFRSSRGVAIERLRPQRLCHGHVIDQGGHAVDEVMIALFKSPSSYTREDMAEIYAHGGMRSLRKILEVLIACGARPAEPGEFTKRAFLNGRLDLAQAEAVLDLIQAKTERAREHALRQLAGELSGAVQAVKDRLLEITAHVEAYVDFPEEEIEIHTSGELAARLDRVVVELDRLITSFEAGAVYRDGVLAVIVGRPNVGKSSLLNALLDWDRALVSALPGTTRDALEEEVEIAGLGIRLVDTAGLRRDAGPVETLGMERTREYIAQGQLYLVVLDGSCPVTAEDLDVYEEVRKKKHIVVVNKRDLPQRIEPDLRRLEARDCARISARTREGLEELRQKMASSLVDGTLTTEGAVVTRLRHKEALAQARGALHRARNGLEEKLPLEFIAFELRQALERLGEIVGEIYTDDILDMIFKEFCIGK